MKIKIVYVVCLCSAISCYRNMFLFRDVIVILFIHTGSAVLLFISFDSTSDRDSVMSCNRNSLMVFSRRFFQFGICLYFFKSEPKFEYLPIGLFPFQKDSLHDLLSDFVTKSIFLKNNLRCKYSCSIYHIFWFFLEKHN